MEIIETLEQQPHADTNQGVIHDLLLVPLEGVESPYSAAGPIIKRGGLDIPLLIGARAGRIETCAGIPVASPPIGVIMSTGTLRISSGASPPRR
jgi:hypothetical protein